tara:strand:+ start:11928 stop:13562 length:1635 start_codon:yes stop_codon:yes gene_type:complete
MSKQGRYIGIYDFLDNTPLDVVNGGTGLGTIGENQIVTGNGTNALTSEANFKFYLDGSTDPTIELTSPEDTGDMFTIATTTHGATTITTIDDDATAANLTFDVDGVIIIDSHTGTSASGGIKIKAAGTEIANINAHHGGTYLQMYENGGASTDDYFTIDVAEHGATTLTTFDGAAAAADLTFNIDGEVKVNAGNFTIESAITQKPNFKLKATVNSNKPSNVEFIKDRGAAGADGDFINTITYISDNDAQEQISFADIQGAVRLAADGAEEGKFTINIKNTTHASQLQESFSLVSNGAATDVNLGYGTTSVTTIAGETVLTKTATLLNNNVLAFNDLDNSHRVNLRGPVTQADTRAISLPDADGTVQLQGENTGQVIHFTLDNPGSYLFYCYNDDNWYSYGTTSLAILGSSTAPGSISSGNSKYQARVAAYTAPSNCVIKKVCFNWFWSSSAVNSADFDFGFSKFTPITDGTAASITMNAITATDHNGSYTENAPYYHTFALSGGNASLSAGESFAMHMRTTGSGTQSGQRVLVYGTITVYLELT